MGGIRVEGENHFVIAPRPGGSFTFANVKYQSIYGLVESSWTREGSECTYHITVPANCTATVTLPGREAQELPAGSYTWAAGRYLINRKAYFRQE